MLAVGGFTVGELVIYAAAVTSGLGVLWRFFVRRGWRAWRRAKLFATTANVIVTRELTHNGGGSLKDVVHSMDRKLSTLADQLESVKSSAHENFDAIEAVAQVMDALVDRKQEDHERLWEQIERLWQQVRALGGHDKRDESHR